MRRYRHPDGHSFVLAEVELTDWADAITAIFLRLGCSIEYAQRAGDQIRASVSV